MQTIKIKLLHENAVMPQRANATDACYDVVATSITTTDGYVEYGLGFATEIPAGWQGLFYPRSSVSKYDLALCNSVGVIDADYRGEWKARFRPTAGLTMVPYRNSSSICTQEIAIGKRLYEIGDRIGQIQFQRVPEVRLELVDELTDSSRGEGGFGSTGVK